MMRIKTILGIVGFSLLILSLPSLAAAQGYSRVQLKNDIKRLKNDSRDFSKFVDRDLDKSKYNGSRREDNLNQLARDFRDAAARLESRFGDGRNLNDSRSEANEVLRIANQVDRVMKRAKLSQNVEDYWHQIDNQLDHISQEYRNRRGGWRN